MDEIGVSYKISRKIAINVLKYNTKITEMHKKNRVKMPSPLRTETKISTVDLRFERSLYVGTASAASLAPAQARRKKDFRYALSRVFSSRCSNWSRAACAPIHHGHFTKTYNWRQEQPKKRGFMI